MPANATVHKARSATAVFSSASCNADQKGEAVEATAAIAAAAARQIWKDPDTDELYAVELDRDVITSAHGPLADEQARAFRSGVTPGNGPLTDVPSVDTQTLEQNRTRFERFNADTEDATPP
jgi:hypothetical protein